MDELKPLSPECLEHKLALTALVAQLPEAEREKPQEVIRELRTDDDVLIAWFGASLAQRARQVALGLN